MRAITLAAAVALGAGPSLLFAQGQREAAGTAEMVATVEHFDAVKRTVSLRGPRGVVTMDVAEDVRNLPRLRVGDRVEVTYAPALALELKRGDASGRETTTVVASSERPEGIVGRALMVVADVTLVHIRNLTVTLRAHERSITLKLRDLGQLKDITAGDRVEATYTQARAVAMRAAGAN